MTNPPAGFYPDPSTGQLRFWNGQGWTDTYGTPIKQPYAQAGPAWGQPPAVLPMTPVAPQATQTPSLSWIALTLAIVGALIIPLVFSTAAIITGHIAYAKGSAQPRLFKTGVAVAALVVGYLGLAYGVITFLSAMSSV